MGEVAKFTRNDIHSYGKHFQTDNTIRQWHSGSKRRHHKLTCNNYE